MDGAGDPLPRRPAPRRDGRGLGAAAQHDLDLVVRDRAPYPRERRLNRVAREETDAQGRARGRREDVVARGAAQPRRDGRRAHERIGLGAEKGKGESQQGPRERERAQRDTERTVHPRRQRREHRADGSDEPRGRGASPQTIDRAGESGGRGQRRRGRGVPSPLVGDELDDDVAPFRDADHRDRTPEPRQNTLHDRAALVEHETRTDAACSEHRGDRARTVAADLLVVSESEIDVALGHMSGDDEALDRLEDRDERALVVDRAAGEERGILTLPLDPGLERRMPPLVRDDRHDIHVRHEHERVARLSARPVEEQRVGRDRLAPERRVQRGIELGEGIREGRETAVVVLAVRERDGGQAQEAPEAVEGRGLLLARHTSEPKPRAPPSSGPRPRPRPPPARTLAPIQAVRTRRMAGPHNPAGTVGEVRTSA